MPYRGQKPARAGWGRFELHVQAPDDAPPWRDAAGSVSGAATAGSPRAAHWGRLTGVGFELVLDLVPHLGLEDERQVAQEWVELVDEHTGKTYSWNPRTPPPGAVQRGRGRRGRRGDFLATLHFLVKVVGFWVRIVILVVPAPLIVFMAVACSSMVLLVRITHWPRSSLISVAFTRLVLLMTLRFAVFPSFVGMR